MSADTFLSLDDAIRTYKKGQVVVVNTRSDRGWMSGVVKRLPCPSRRHKYYKVEIPGYGLASVTEDEMRSDAGSEQPTR